MIKTKKQTNEKTDNNLPVSKYLRSFMQKIVNGSVLKTIFIAFILMFLNIGAKSPLLSSQKSASDSNVYPISVRQRVHEQLVTEVQLYIQSIAPKSKLNADTLVTLCQKYEIDITFVLAQGLIESHFGTRGRAAGVPSKKIPPTNSVFNVGTYDDGKIIYNYKTQDASVEPFLTLLKTHYLTNKTITQLLRDGGYKSKDGYRYATSTTYEYNLREAMRKIMMGTKIGVYQGIINFNDEQITAFFAPPTTSTENLTAMN